MRGRSAAAPAGAAVLVAAFAVVMLARPGGDPVVTVVDDVSVAAGGLLAAAALALRARRCVGLTRYSWALLAAGAFCAGLGDTIWAWYELVLDQAGPFPSPADAAYLLFPVFTGAGLLTYQGAGRFGSASIRHFLDGVLVSGSLFALSWATALGAVTRAGADSTLGFAVSVAYPTTDVILVTITVLVLTRNSMRGQRSLLLLGAGLISLTLADSGFTYLSTVGTYATGTVIDTGYLAAYLLLALAAIAGTPPPRDTTQPAAPPPRWAVTVPYLLCAVGVLVSVAPLVRRAALVPLTTAGILVASLLARQLLTITDNRRLLGDVAERERRLHHQAFHDDLTGLANRALFADRLDHALTLHEVDRRAIAVLFLDLDDFKVVNDSLGHDAGDALLVRVAERLRAAVGASDTVARFGGDEFAVLVEDYHVPADVASRVSESFAQPFVVAGQTMRIGASLGVALTDASDTWPSAPELLKRADLAMYAAKRGGQGDYVVFTPDLAEVSEREFDIRDALARAIASQAIDVAFQPIFATDTGRLLGFEALARWRLNGSPVPPDVFLPVARRLGLIVELDLLVLRRALRELAGWRRTPAGRGLTCAVNANESLLDVPDIVAVYSETLLRHGLPPSALVVELPERHLSDSTALASTVADLRAIGISVALDDFGTHDSSLARLHRVRVDTVKLDRDFLVPGPGGPIDQQWLGGVIDLAHRLGMRVVAEGVETTDQLDTLRQLRCDAIQGFLLGCPVPAHEVSIRAAGVPWPRSAPATSGAMDARTPPG